MGERKWEIGAVGIAPFVFTLVVPVIVCAAPEHPTGMHRQLNAVFAVFAVFAVVPEERIKEVHFLPLR